MSVAALLLSLAATAVAGCTVGKSRTQCGASCVTCGADEKCHDCVPGQPTCSGGSIAACNADGTVGAVTKACAAGEQCMAGACVGACEAAAMTHSYLGCDYWPVTTLNATLNPAFHFAVAVANPGMSADGMLAGTPAQITVERAGQTVATATVMPGDVQAITLPWVTPLSQNQSNSPQSVLLPHAAYHLTSTVPVSVYQFNPLEFELPSSPTCMDQQSPDPTKCHSYSNDATLLLPTAALRGEYVVVSRETFAVNGGASPGFFAVVATEDKTTVTVTYSAHTQDSPSVPAKAPGETATYTLDAGAVLQVTSARVAMPCAATSSDGQASYCDMGKDYDLTGSHVVADKAVALIGGHSCSFVPYDRWACDHLETEVLPLDTWGQSAIVVQTEPQQPSEPNLFRVVSGSDGNVVTFDPPTVHDGVMLARGEYVELTAQGGFAVKGTGRTLVAQYMVGQNYDPQHPAPVGDPSLGQGVPVEQYRTTYDFLTPDTYTKSYITVVAQPGASLTLDGNALTGATTPVGSTGYSYQRVQVANGAHHIGGMTPFGLTVSGVAPYTSYLYVGGLDLKSVPLQ